MTLEAIEKELFFLQQDRLAKFNADQERFKKLEKNIDELQKSNDAQIKINQLFNKQIIDLESRPVIIPNSVPTAFIDDVTIISPADVFLRIIKWFKKK